MPQAKPVPVPEPMPAVVESCPSSSLSPTPPLPFIHVPLPVPDAEADADAGAAPPGVVLPFAIPSSVAPVVVVTPTITVPAKKSRNGTEVTSTGTGGRRSRTARLPTDDDGPGPLPDADPSAPFDLLSAMRSDRRLDSSARTEIVRLYSFPAYLSLNLRRVLARDRTQRANTPQALSCLIWHGIARYHGLESVKSFTAALARLELDDDVPARVAEQIEGWKRGLKFNLADPTHAMGLEKSRSFRVPEQVHSELFDLAGKLGVPGSTLGTMCVVSGLMDQGGVLKEHGAYMRAAVDELDGQLADRERRLQGLLGLVASGTWP